MADLKYITMTQLFWDTLEKHRGHSRYPEIRAKIAWCVERKMENRMFSNNSDSPFISNVHLAGIWHCKLSVNPDVVMFYTLDDDTFNLAMVGSHHDYPHGGKYTRRSEPFGKRVRSALSTGHVPTPDWERIKWNEPADILASHELEEVSLDHLAAIMDELELELHDAPIFRRLRGSELLDADEETIEAWLSVTDQALEAVKQAQTRVRAIARDRENERSPIAAFGKTPAAAP